ncbi:MAG: hypothetical protein KIS96_03080 [Bauldia sp.]|nr:hypothetical protein [Bauldia sp.]
MSDDPRYDSTRRWSNTRLTLVILGLIVVFAVAGSVYFIMAGGAGTENTALEEAAVPPD